MRKVLKIFLLSLTSMWLSLSANGQTRTIKGTVQDAKTKEPIPYATVFVKELATGAASDLDGNFIIQDVKIPKCVLMISCLSYKTVEINHSLGDTNKLTVLLESTDVQLEGITVKGRKESNTEASMISTQKALPQVTSGISAAQISKSPDRVASEVVKRISGVSVIDDRYIIVRGLSQRYNNAWINGLAVPSTEIDSRAFPLDLLPSSQIDNLLIYKSPSPEIPSDFSGGFIHITSKSIPDENRIEIGYTTGFNVKTQFNTFRYNAGSSTDFIGFGAGKRSLASDFPAYLDVNKTTPDELTSLTKNAFNNDWSIKNRIPVPDQRLSFMIARRIEKENRKVIGNVTALTYSNTFKHIQNMKNSRYGIYSATSDMPICLDDYIDNQYANDVRLGLLHNWAFVLSSSNRIEFKNLLNNLSRNRLTERTGIKDMSSMYYREHTEFQYTSRLTYSGQVSGTHDFSTNKTLTWDVGYSFADRNEPDRRIVAKSTGITSPEDIPSVTATGTDNISRYFQHLADHTFSAAVNYKHTFRIGQNFKPTLKAGAYGEYRMREFKNRLFEYDYSRLPYEERRIYIMLPFVQMMDEQYFGADKVYIEETSKKTNNYSARVGHGAAYVAFEIPISKFSMYAGVRLENQNTRLTRDRSMLPNKTQIEHRDTNELNVLPSANLTYRFSKKHQLRGAYGMSVNRPELREISPSVYYDFDLFNEVGGNENLKTAIIHNADLRYEFYPSHGEIISVGVFYKHFKNPIEWTFIDMGGSLHYLFENADKADNYGIEIEMRKSLDFIKLPSFTLLVNAAFIKSNVRFNPGEVLLEPDRPMQGQSPYIVNAGLFYRSKKGGWDVSLLYNRIGKRIVGLGKSNNPNGDINSMIPDSYEMPRNVLDFTISKSFGKHVELRFSIKDILSEDIVFKQFPKFEKDGTTHQREQTTRKYNPGQTFSLGVGVKL